MTTDIGLTTTITDIELTFEAPGPGGWQRLADHFPGALTAEYQLLYAETAPPAMAANFERYGVIAGGLDVAYVHGHLYIAPVPLAGPSEMKRTPPSALVWLLARVHPAFRRRTAAARHALEARPWRDVTQRWFDTERFEWQQRDEAMEALDPAEMTVVELAAHLTDCRRLAVDGYTRHFELHGDDLIPVGLLIARCEEWGIDPAIALQALNGSAPSESPTDPPTWQLVTGYDLDALTWGEMSHRSGARDSMTARPADLTALFDRRDRIELQALVDDARRATRLRDDNGLLTGAWPMGLLRRSMLEAGRRLGFDDPTLAVEMTVAELIDALGDENQPDPTSVVARRNHRRGRSALDAPLTLGPRFPIPTLSALPRPLALIGAAQLAAADHMTGAGAVGVGAVTYVGRALVVDDPLTALDLLEPGDVVITRFTSPSWNAVLTQAGGLVTTTGGLACHGATIARELAIPAVIGDATAFDRLRTGDTVSLDPATATVAIVSRSMQQSPGK